MMDPQILPRPPRTTENKHQDGGVEVELVGHNGGVIHSEQGAGGTGQGGGGDEGHHLVLGDVEAHALGGDAVIPDSHDGPSGPAVHQVEHHDQGDHHQNKAGGEGGDLLDAADAHGTADDKGAVFGEVRGVAQEG